MKAETTEKIERAARKSLPNIGSMYWTKRKGYVEAPKHVSLNQYVHDRKYYAKEDILLLNDHKEQADERDPTKPYREQKKAEPGRDAEKK